MGGTDEAGKKRQQWRSEAVRERESGSRSRILEVVCEGYDTRLAASLRPVWLLVD
jgi:hypothetical protein